MLHHRALKYIFIYWGHALIYIYVCTNTTRLHILRKISRNISWGFKWYTCQKMLALVRLYWSCWRWAWVMDKGASVFQVATCMVWCPWEASAGKWSCARAQRRNWIQGQQKWEHNQSRGIWQGIQIFNFYQLCPPLIIWPKKLILTSEVEMIKPGGVFLHDSMHNLRWALDFRWNWRDQVTEGRKTGEQSPWTGSRGWSGTRGWE